MSQNIESLAERISLDWGILKVFIDPPPGVACEFVVTERDMRLHYKSFDEFISRESASLDLIISKMIGIDNDYIAIHSAIDLARTRIQKAMPKILNNSRDLRACLFQTHQYLIKYIAVGEKSVFGEYVLQTYPNCGVPCGFDERENLISLFLPDLQLSPPSNLENRGK